MTSSRTTFPAGRLLANLLTLGRDLRGAGLNVGSGQVINLVEAVSAVDCRAVKTISTRPRKRRSSTVPDQIPVFDAIFDQFWRQVMNSVAAGRVCDS